MLIKPELIRAKDYYENFIKVAIKSKEHLELFVSKLEKFTEEEKAFFLEYWDIDQQGGCAEVISEEDYDDMTKDELEEYALKEFNVDLDKRHNIATLIEEVIELKEEKED